MTTDHQTRVRRTIADTVDIVTDMLEYVCWGDVGC